jgi:hypothetical protein
MIIFQVDRLCGTRPPFSFCSSERGGWRRGEGIKAVGNKDWCTGRQLERGRRGVGEGRKGSR